MLARPQPLVAAPQRFRDHRGIGRAAALVNRTHQAIQVHGDAQRLAHPAVIHRLPVGSERDVADGGDTRLLHAQLRVGAHGGQVRRVGVAHDLALVGAQLGIAHGSVRGDGEHQVVHLRSARRPGGLAPEIRVGAEPHHAVPLILHELERAGADRHLVQLLGLARLCQGVGILGRRYGKRLHGERVEQGRQRRLQLDGDGVVVHLADGLERRLDQHLELGVAAADLVIRGVLVGHPVEGEHHVVGVKLTGGLEQGVGLPLDPLSQLEGIGQAVLGHRPGLRQAGNQLRPADLHTDQPVGGLLRHVEAGIGRAEGGVQEVRAALRAHRQGVSLRLGREQQGRDGKGGQPVGHHVLRKTGSKCQADARQGQWPTRTCTGTHWVSAPSCAPGKGRVSVSYHGPTL